MTRTPALKIALYRKISLIFAVLAFILFITVVYFSFAKAQIEITPIAQTSSIDFIAAVQSDSIEADVLAGKILEKEVLAEKVFNVTSTKEIQSNVLGEVTVYNKTSNSQTLVATTRLLSADEILLRINKKVVVPAQGQAKVEVYADKPESFTSLAPTKFIIPGLNKSLQEDIYAESQDSLVAGTRQVKILAQSDLDQAKKELADSVVEQTLKDLATQAGVSEIRKDQAVFEVEDFSSSDPVNTETDDFTAKIKIKVVGVAVDQTKLLQLAQAKILGQYPSAADQTALSGGQVTYAVQIYDVTKQTAKLKVSYQSNINLQPDSQILDKTKLAGLTVDEAREYLSQYPEIKEVKISLQPFWVSHLPKNSDSIEIKIAGE